MEIENDRFLVYSMIIHCADFFGNAKTFEISKNFVVLLPGNVDLEEIPKAFEGILLAER